MGNTDSKIEKEADPSYGFKISREAIDKLEGKTHKPKSSWDLKPSFDAEPDSSRDNNNPKEETIIVDNAELEAKGKEILLLRNELEESRQTYQKLLQTKQQEENKRKNEKEETEANKERQIQMSVAQLNEKYNKVQNNTIVWGVKSEESCKTIALLLTECYKNINNPLQCSNLIQQYQSCVQKQ